MFIQGCWLLVLLHQTKKKKKSKCCLLALITALWDSVVEFHTAILSVLGCGRCGDLHYSVLCYTLKQKQQCAD